MIENSCPMELGSIRNATTAHSEDPRPAIPPPAGVLMGHYTHFQNTILTPKWMVDLQSSGGTHGPVSDG